MQLGNMIFVTDLLCNEASTPIVNSGMLIIQKSDCRIKIVELKIRRHIPKSTNSVLTWSIYYICVENMRIFQKQNIRILLSL